jgi:hypothetical protein
LKIVLFISYPYLCRFKNPTWLRWLRSRDVRRTTG